MNWPLVELCEVARLINGRAYNKDELLNEGKYPVLRVGNFFSNRGWYFSDLELDDKNYCSNGDLLYAWSASFGPKIWDGEKTIFHYHIWKLELNSSLVDKKYLYHALFSDVEKIKREQGSGSTMIHVTKAAMEKRKIPLPPLAEQKRIASILDKADAIRRKRQQAIKLADEFLHSVFLDMFGDPVSNPKGWEVKSLGELAELINGDRSSNYPSGDDLKERGILFLNTKNIIDQAIELKDPVFITEDKFNSLSRGKLKKNDLVITLRGTLGSCAIFNNGYETGFINAQLMIIRPKYFVMSDFLHAFLTTNQIQDKFQSLGRGAAVPQLTAAQMRDLGVYVPPVNLMSKFSEIKQKILITKLNFSESQKFNLFDAVSQQAFSSNL